MNIAKNCLAALATAAIFSTSAGAVTVTDNTLYSDLTSTHSYTLDLGDVAEAEASTVDVGFGGWNGIIPVFGPYLSGEFLVNSVLVGVFDVTSGIFSNGGNTASYDTTGLLQDGVNVFAFTPTFFSAEYESFAFNAFEVNFAQAEENAVSAVPLPASVLLLLAGLGAMGAMGAGRKTA